MRHKLAACLLASTSLFIPIQAISAKELQTDLCSITTIEQASGAIIWRDDAVSKAQSESLRLAGVSAADHHRSCLYTIYYHSPSPTLSEVPSRSGVLLPENAIILSQLAGGAAASGASASGAAAAAAAGSGVATAVVAGAVVVAAAGGGGGGGGGDDAPIETPSDPVDAEPEDREVVPDPEEPDPVEPDPVEPDPVVPAPVVPDPVVPEPEFFEKTTDFTYDPALDATWTNRQEYKNVAEYVSSSTINPYTLIGVNNAYARGLSGDNRTIAIVDTAWFPGIHLEAVGKNITTYGDLTTGSDNTSWHGVHVAGIAAAGYHGDNSSFNSLYEGSHWPLLSYGTMGVAYDASLHISDFRTVEDGSYFKHLASATRDAAEHNAIAQNNSWAWRLCGTSTGCDTIDLVLNYKRNNDISAAQALAHWLSDSSDNMSDYISALDEFQETGVVVFSAGNDINSENVHILGGLPLLVPELEDAWLAIGNLDTSGSEAASATYSRMGNQCGLAAEFCIYADGTDIASPIGNDNASQNNRYGLLSGTSMSVPQVSGSVALLSEAFPNHTPDQLVDRLLASANNRFFTPTDNTTFINGVTHGYDAEFGHGLVSLADALEPISSPTIAVASATSRDAGGAFGDIQDASRFDLSASKVCLGSAFGDSLPKSLAGKKAYFYDGLNGGFPFDFGSLVTDHVPARVSQHSLERMIYGSSVSFDRTEAGIHFLHDRKLANDENMGISGSMMAIIPLSAFGSDLEGSEAFIGRHIHIQNALSFTQRSLGGRSGAADHTINSDSPFNIPFLQASEQGSASGSRLSLDKAVLSFGTFDGASADFGLDTSGFVLEYATGGYIDGGYASNGHLSPVHVPGLSVFAGSTTEADGFLETSIEGAFAETATAETKFIGMSAYGHLGMNWSYDAVLTTGSTEMQVGGVGLLSDIRDIKSSAFGLEFSRPVHLREQDSLYIGLSQPLRIESGRAAILVPQLYDRGGALNFDKQQVELSPSGRQLDLSVGYKAVAHNVIDWGVQLGISQDYGHVKSNDYVSSVGAFLKFDL